MPESLPTDRYDQEERIRRELESARQEVAASLLALRHKVTRPFAWRMAVRRRPLAVVIGGVFVGFTVALLTGARWKDGR